MIDANNARERETSDPERENAEPANSRDIEFVTISDDDSLERAIQPNLADEIREDNPSPIVFDRSRYERLRRRPRTRK